MGIKVHNIEQKLRKWRQ